jgi:hypothetical protein
MKIQVGGIVCVGQPVDQEYYKEKFRWTATWSSENPIRELLQGEPAGSALTRRGAMVDLLKRTEIKKIGDYQT